MGNILSQNEIDNLLDALNAGDDLDLSGKAEEGEQNVRPYDFRTANKFYKEQMRTLSIIFDTFAYLFSNKLTALLHTLCEVEVVSIEEQSFGEFNNSISSPVLLGIVEMMPLQGSLLLEISPVLAYGIISRLFGGAADYTLTTKPFTEIETYIVENIMHQTMGIMKDSWKKILEVEPVLTRMESSSQFTQIAAMNEPAAIITMNAKIDEIEGLISVCIPHLAIQPISKELNTASWSIARGTNQAQAEKKDIIKDHLGNTCVSLRAVFNETQTTLKEVLSIKVGDFLRLDHSINEYIKVYLEQVPKFEGVIGVDKQKYAVQIAKIIKENDKVE